MLEHCAFGTIWLLFAYELRIWCIKRALVDCSDRAHPNYYYERFQILANWMVKIKHILISNPFTLPIFVHSTSFVRCIFVICLKFSTFVCNYEYMYIVCVFTLRPFNNFFEGIFTAVHFINIFIISLYDLHVKTKIVASFLFVFIVIVAVVLQPPSDTCTHLHATIIHYNFIHSKQLTKTHSLDKLQICSFPDSIPSLKSLHAYLDCWII